MNKIKILLYKDMPQNIRMNTPDLAFVYALCAVRADEVAALFREKKQGAGRLT